MAVHGYGRAAARDLLRRMRDRASYHRTASHDGADFSLDYSLTGARYGRGHFIFMEDEPEEMRRARRT